MIISELEISRPPYSLTRIEKSQVENIRIWRNSQISVLRQTHPISKTEQESYFKNMVFPQYKLQFPNQILLSFLKSNVLIGYGGLVNISWDNRRAEMSILMDNQRAEEDSTYEQDLSVYIELIKDVAFKKLDLNRLYVETYDFRKFHISILEMNGFELEGRMIKHIFQNGHYCDSTIHGLINPNSQFDG